jgi:hypothetical protein
VRGIRITIKVVVFLVKKLEGLSDVGRSASGGKVRKLEGSKVERVSGYGPLCGLKPQRVWEFFTSSHDLKVVAINCNNYHTLNLCYSPVV